MMMMRGGGGLGADATPPTPSSSAAAQIVNRGGNEDGRYKSTSIKNLSRGIHSTVLGLLASRSMYLYRGDQLEIMPRAAGIAARRD